MVQIEKCDGVEKTQPEASAVLQAHKVFKPGINAYQNLLIVYLSSKRFEWLRIHFSLHLGRTGYS